jgi:hypothetical protein
MSGDKRGNRTQEVAGSIPIRSTNPFDNLARCGLEFRHFLLDDSPDDLEIHSKVVVNDLVAHTRNLLPRDL